MHVSLAKSDDMRCLLTGYAHFCIRRLLPNDDPHDQVWGQSVGTVGVLIASEARSRTIVS